MIQIPNFLSFSKTIACIKTNGLPLQNSMKLSFAFFKFFGLLEDFFKNVEDGVSEQTKMLVFAIFYFFTELSLIPRQIVFRGGIRFSD